MVGPFVLVVFFSLFHWPRFYWMKLPYNLTCVLFSIKVDSQPIVIRMFIFIKLIMVHFHKGFVYRCSLHSPSLVHQVRGLGFK